MPIHPFLVAVYPVVYLFAANAATEVTLDPVWIPLALARCSPAPARTWRRSSSFGTWPAERSLPASGLALFFSFGHVWNVVGDAPLRQPKYDLHPIPRPGR